MINSWENLNPPPPPQPTPVLLLSSLLIAYIVSCLLNWQLNNDQVMVASEAPRNGSEKLKHRLHRHTKNSGTKELFDKQQAL